MDNLSSVKLQCACFDLYGTLADIRVDETRPEVWEQLADYIAARGVDIPAGALRQRFLDLSAAEVERRGEGFAMSGVFRQLLGSYHRMASAELNVRSLAREFRRVTTIGLELKPYTLSVLRFLRERGIKTAIVSNTEALLTQRDIEVTGLDTYVDDIVLSSEIGVKKPARGILDVALSQLGAISGSSAMIGDTWETDILGAIRSGLIALYLDPDASTGSVKIDRERDRVLWVHPDEKAILSAFTMLGVTAE